MIGPRSASGGAVAPDFRRGFTRRNLEQLRQVFHNQIGLGFGGEVGEVAADVTFILTAPNVAVVNAYRSSRNLASLLLIFCGVAVEPAEGTVTTLAA